MPEQKTQATPTNPPAQPAAQANAAAITPSSSTNGFAIASLVLGIISILVSLVWFMGLVPILGIIFGILGLSKKYEGKNKGMAIAGLVMSIIGIVLMIGWGIFWLVLAASSPSTNYSY